MKKELIKKKDIKKITKMSVPADQDEYQTAEEHSSQ